jgi:hypothetical protein
MATESMKRVRERTGLKVLVASTVQNNVDTSSGTGSAREELGYLFDIPRNATILSQLIFNQSYDDAVQRLCDHPEEASTWVCVQIDQDRSNKNSTLNDNDNRSDDLQQEYSATLLSPKRYAFRQLPIHMACHNLRFMTTSESQVEWQQASPKKASLEKLIIHLALAYPIGCTMCDHCGRYPLHQVLGDARCRDGNFVLAKETLSILLMAAPLVINCPDRFGRLPIDLVRGKLNTRISTEKLASTNGDENDFDSDTVFDMLNRGADFWHLAREEAMICLKHKNLSDDTEGDTPEISVEENLLVEEEGSDPQSQTDSLEPTTSYHTANYVDAITSSSTTQSSVIPDPNICCPKTNQTTDDISLSVDTQRSSSSENPGATVCIDHASKTVIIPDETMENQTVRTEAMSDEASLIATKTLSFPVDDFTSLRSNDNTKNDSVTIDRLQQLQIQYNPSSDDAIEKKSFSLNTHNSPEYCHDENDLKLREESKEIPKEKFIMLSPERIMRDDYEMSTISISPSQSFVSRTEVGDRVCFMKQMLTESYHTNYELTQKITELELKNSRLNEVVESWKGQYHALNEELANKMNDKKRENVSLQEKINELQQREAHFKHHVQCLNIALDANGISFVVPDISELTLNKVKSPRENSSNAAATFDESDESKDQGIKISNGNDVGKELQANSLLSIDIHEMNHERQKLERENVSLKNRESRYLLELQEAKDRIAMLEKVVEMASRPTIECSTQTAEVQNSAADNVSKESPICQMNMSLSYDIHEMNHERQKLERDILLLKEKEVHYLSEQEAAKTRIAELEKILEMTSLPSRGKTPIAIREKRVETTSLDTNENNHRSLSAVHAMSSSDATFVSRDRTSQFHNENTSFDAIYLHDNRRQKDEDVVRESTSIARPVPLKPLSYHADRGVTKETIKIDEGVSRTTAFIPIRTDSVIDTCNDERSWNVPDKINKSSKPRPYGDMLPDGHFLMHMKAPFSQLPRPDAYTRCPDPTKGQKISHTCRQDKVGREAKLEVVDVSMINQSLLTPDLSAKDTRNLNQAMNQEISHASRQDNKVGRDVVDVGWINQSLLTPDLSAKDTRSLDQAMGQEISHASRQDKVGREAKLKVLDVSMMNQSLLTPDLSLNDIRSRDQPIGKEIFHASLHDQGGREAKLEVVDVTMMNQSLLTINSKPILIEDAELAYATTSRYRTETTKQILGSGKETVSTTTVQQHPRNGRARTLPYFLNPYLLEKVTISPTQIVRMERLSQPRNVWAGRYVIRPLCIILISTKVDTLVRKVP